MPHDAEAGDIRAGMNRIFAHHRRSDGIQCRHRSYRGIDALFGCFGFFESRGDDARAERLGQN